MVALRITDLKIFTSKLLLGESFDMFLTREAEIVTFNRFTIDGHIRHGYYSDDELEEKQIEQLSSWKVLRPICYALIKGNRLPGSFQIILLLGPGAVETFLKERQIQMSPEYVTGLYINIRYEEGCLTCVTGTSVSIFTMDQSLNREWDQWVKDFLKQEQIVFEEG